MGMNLGRTHGRQIHALSERRPIYLFWEGNFPRRVQRVDVVRNYMYVRRLRIDCLPWWFSSPPLRSLPFCSRR